jgi:hypothetical protein
MGYLGKGEMLTDRDANKFVHKLLGRMQHFWDLLLQLMKHGTNTLHVVFIFLFSIYAIKQMLLSRTI